MHHRSECLGLREGKGGGGWGGNKVKKIVLTPARWQFYKLTLPCAHTDILNQLDRSQKRDVQRTGVKQVIDWKKRTSSVVGRREGECWTNAEGREQRSGCRHHHFFWGVESFCIPRILSSSSETKSCRGARTDRAGLQRQVEVGRVGADGWKERLTSVGLKQSTSKSCKGRSRKRISVYVGGCFVIRAGRSVGTYLDPGCPLYVTRHVQQLVHVDLQLGYGLLLQPYGKKRTVSSFSRNMERKPSSCFSFSASWSFCVDTTRFDR